MINKFNNLIKKIRNKIYIFLRWTEKWTKTDMVYLTKGGGWIGINKVISSICALIISIASANLLSGETYGTYKYILSIFSIISITNLPGIETALVNYVSKGYEGDLINSLKTKIKWGFVGSVISLSLGLYYLLNNNQILGISLLITTFFIPIYDSFQIYNAFLGGKKLFNISSIFNIISNIILTFFLIICFWSTQNVIIIIFCYLISNWILRVIFFVITIKNYQTNKNKNQGIITYGKHLTVMNVIGAISEQFDKLALWHFLGPTSLAIYYFSIAPINQINALLKTIHPLSQPKLALQNKDVIKKTLPSKMLIFYVVVIIIFLSYAFIAPFAFKILFPKYTESIKYSILFATTLLFFPQKLMSIALTSHEKKKPLYIIGTINPILNILLLIIFIPLYGIWGAIIAQIIPYIINFVILLYFFKKM